MAESSHFISVNPLWCVIHVRVLMSWGQVTLQSLPSIVCLSENNVHFLTVICVAGNYGNCYLFLQREMESQIHASATPDPAITGSPSSRLFIGNFMKPYFKDKDTALVSVHS